jgi:glycosyltransferase involved in cell wall biosynthesis
LQLSIVVCAYNGSAHLQRLLDSLQRMNVTPAIPWEIVVVDNNSTDATRAVVADAARRQAANIRYVFEPRQGKCYALNTGIRMSQGELIAFTDQDMIVPEDWAESIVREFSGDADLDVLGGKVELYNPAHRPVAIRTMSERFALSRATYSADNIPIIGCNLAVRRAVFDTVGLFDIRLGPGSRTNGAAEDTDWIYRALVHDLNAAYVPDVCIYHNHGCDTDEALAVRLRLYVVGRGAFYLKHAIAGDRQVMKMAYWELHSCVAQAARKLARGASPRAELRHVGHLAMGALAYVRHSWFGDTQGNGKERRKANAATVPLRKALSSAIYSLVITPDHYIPWR